MWQGVVGSQDPGCGLEGQIGVPVHMTLGGLLTPWGQLQPQDGQRRTPQSLGPRPGEELCPLWVEVASPVW